MRVTKKYLADFLNNWLNNIGEPRRVDYNKIETTRFRSSDYECGATKLFILAELEGYLPYQIYSMYTLGELTNLCNNGDELHLYFPFRTDETWVCTKRKL